MRSESRNWGELIAGSEDGGRAQELRTPGVLPKLEQTGDGFSSRGTTRELGPANTFILAK